MLQALQNLQIHVYCKVFVYVTLFLLLIELVTSRVFSFIAVRRCCVLLRNMCLMKCQKEVSSFLVTGCLLVSDKRVSAEDAREGAGKLLPDRIL